MIPASCQLPFPRFSLREGIFIVKQADVPFQPYRNTAWRDAAPLALAKALPQPQRRVSSWSFTSMMRALIRGSISSQGRFDLPLIPAGIGGSWSRKGDSISLSITALAAQCAHLGCCCAHLHSARAVDGKQQVTECCEGQGEDLCHQACRVC